MFNAQTGPGSVTGQALYKGRINLVKMLILVATLFAIAWIPYFTLFLYQKITGKSDVSEFNGEIAMLRVALAVFSTAYNFLLYVAYNRNFRNGFKALLPCKGIKVLRAFNTVGPAGESRTPNYNDVSQNTSVAFTLRAREPTVS
ncbi:substance-k receptor-like [Plakobranchus ocellatus]|uniref:Substance-k receptor-like n=1 Tax=Plakobranchus ocellatus TaxID=259542 RepID=A0AAV3YF84_9GAST|nr:substance-k receptor-like [Plakobranchus ocellatus]